MEDKILEEKGLEADFVYDGYNKANLMAAAEKGGSDKKKTCQEALETPKMLVKLKIQVWSSVLLLSIGTKPGFSLAGLFIKIKKINRMMRS